VTMRSRGNARESRLATDVRAESRCLFGQGSSMLTNLGWPRLPGCVLCAYGKAKRDRFLVVVFCLPGRAAPNLGSAERTTTRRMEVAFCAHREPPHSVLGS
jgi:hypothetical protein